MNTKSLLLVTALCSSASLPFLFAQSGGSGGSGGSAGSAGAAGSASAPAGSNAPAASASAIPGSATTANPASPSAQTNAAGTSGNAPSTAPGNTRGAPDTRSSMPSHPVLDSELPVAPNHSATEPANLPSGLSAPPAREGVSPLSGVPLSELPAVSRGTTPIGPNATVPPAAESQANSASAVNPASSAGRVDTTAAPLSSPIGAGTSTVVPTPPPEPRMEANPAGQKNDEGNVWVAGHYSWLAGQWAWIDGAWQRPPSASATWVPGSYDAQTKRWTDGHWNVAGAAAPTRN